MPVMTHDWEHLSMYAGSNCIVHETLSVSAAIVLKGWRINTKVGKYQIYCLGFPSSSALTTDTSLQQKR